MIYANFIGNFPVGELEWALSVQIILSNRPRKILNVFKQNPTYLYWIGQIPSSLFLKISCPQYWQQTSGCLIASDDIQARSSRRTYRTYRQGNCFQLIIDCSLSAHETVLVLIEQYLGENIGSIKVLNLISVGIQCAAARLSQLCHYCPSLLCLAVYISVLNWICVIVSEPTTNPLIKYLHLCLKHIQRLLFHHSLRKRVPKTWDWLKENKHCLICIKWETADFWTVAPGSSFTHNKKCSHPIHKALKEFNGPDKGEIGQAILPVYSLHRCCLTWVYPALCILLNIPASTVSSVLLLHSSC